MNFFMTKAAKSYSARGASGQQYSFNPTKPTKVQPKDSAIFRLNGSLIECDEDGALVGQSGTGKAQPASYMKFNATNRTTGPAQKDSQPRSRGR